MEFSYSMGDGLQAETTMFAELPFCFSQLPKRTGHGQTFRDVFQMCEKSL